MLKFFRQYNKIVLVIGASLLMVAFLLQPVMSMLMPSGANRPVGHTADMSFTGEQYDEAQMDLFVLENLSQLSLPQLILLRAPLSDDHEVEHWMLMLHEAEAMGLGASRADVDAMMSALGLDERALAMLRERRMSEGAVRAALRSWLTLAQYRDLMLGVSLPAAGIASGSAGLGTVQYMTQFGPQLAPPLSGAVIRHTLADAQQAVEGRFALIEAADLLDRVGDPSQEATDALFETYRGVTPDHEITEALPLPFGYRVPNRVRVEVLTLPVEPLMAAAAAEVTATDVIERFDENPSKYIFPGEEAEEGEAADMTAEQSRRVRFELERERAAAIGERLAREAQRQLGANLMTLPREMAYYVLGDDFEPVEMEEVAQRLRESGEGDLEVSAQMNELTQQWLNVSDLEKLPGIGRAYLLGRQSVSVAEYVSSAKELEPAADDPLTNLRLQVGVPSEPLRSYDGSFHILRLTAAEPDHAPRDQAEVGRELMRDARLLAAYGMVKESAERYRELAVAGGLDAVVSQVPEAQVFPLGPLPRRGMDVTGQMVSPPVVPLDESGPLVEAVFEFVGGLDLAGRPLSELPREERVMEVTLPRALAVAVVELEELRGMSEGSYRQQASRPQTPMAVGTWLDSQVEAENPLTYEAVKGRLGYESREEG